MSAGAPLDDHDRRALMAHMNEDHVEALVLYARAFADLGNATAATLVDIDTGSLHLQVMADGDYHDVRIALPRPTGRRAELRAILVDMVRVARAQLAEP